MKKESKIKLFWVSIYAIAMGFLEAAVVIYIRMIYYPNGFDFPLKWFGTNILNIELIREFATIIMLVSIVILVGKKFYERFAYFIYAFAIWDIFYYIFLKLTLNWPPSFLTWDVLFLIPWAWVGPVITPITCSILLVIMALLIIRFQDKGKEISISSLEWCLFILGMILTLYTWLSDYSRLIFTGNPEVYKLISTYIPTDYNWILFYVGILLVVVGITAFYERERKSKH